MLAVTRCANATPVNEVPGSRHWRTTDHRGKIDSVDFVTHLLEQDYPNARRIHLVLDNLNPHFHVCFEDVLGVKAARHRMRRVVFHDTPKHASWLKMAEIEFGILDRQCLDRRLQTRSLLAAEVAAWEPRRNAERRSIAWTFTRQDAHRKMSQHYVS